MEFSAAATFTPELRVHPSTWHRCDGATGGPRRGSGAPSGSPIAVSRAAQAAGCGIAQGSMRAALAAIGDPTRTAPLAWSRVSNSLSFKGLCRVRPANASCRAYCTGLSRAITARAATRGRERPGSPGDIPLRRSVAIDPIRFLHAMRSRHSSLHNSDYFLIISFSHRLRNICKTQISAFFKLCFLSTSGSKVIGS